MSKYSATDLQLRSEILETHSLLIEFLTLDIMHNLVHLFDEGCCNGNHFTHKTIAGFIEEERNARGLDNNNVTISSKADKHSPASSLFLLEIKKNGKEFIHLTIHLVSKRRDPKKEGMLHIKKDIYTVKRTCRDKDEFYTLLKVEKPNHKSLRFSIAFGYNTIGSPLASIYDHEVQQEMDVIVSVLNKMFDACNDDYFVGNDEMRLFLPIQNKTNILLSNMNNHTNIVTRKNWGQMMNISKLRQPINISSNFNINTSKNNVNSKRITRKSHKNIRSYTRKTAHKLHK